MDVELLARMLRELVTSHDEVGLPGVGTFKAELVPATFSDRGFTINPPYRKLSFSSECTENDLLVDFYARMNSVPAEAARIYLTQFLSEMKTVLTQRKTIVLPQLGRLRATRENNLFFVADEKLDIYPEGFALGPVSLKSLSGSSEATDIPFVFNPQEAFATAQDAQETEPIAAEEEEIPAEEIPVEEIPAEEILPVEEEPVGEEVPVIEEELPVVEELIPETEEETPAVEEEIVLAKEAEKQEITEESQPAEKKRRRWWIGPLVLVGVAAVALAAFIILAHAAPDLIDRILYTPEELRIINY